MKLLCYFIMLLASLLLKLLKLGLSPSLYSSHKQSTKAYIQHPFFCNLVTETSLEEKRQQARVVYTLTLDFLVRSGYKQSCIVVLCDRGDAFCKWDVGLWGESYRSFYSQIFSHSFRHNSIPIIPK